MVQKHLGCAFVWWLGCVGNILAQPTPLAPLPGVENPFQVTSQIYSGGVPEGQAAFAALQNLGIKTIVSVDGMRPNIELAERYGLQYVHVPLPYSGISRESALRLTRVMREAEGPVFVHCHHGKHRGPAAAAVCALSKGSLTEDQVIRYMEQAGTGPNYRGLWQAVRDYRPPAPNAPLPELQAVVRPGTMVEIMVQMDAAFEPLQVWAKGKEPIHEEQVVQARLLTEETVELLRNPDLKLSPELRALFAKFEQKAQELEQTLGRDETNAARQQIKLLTENCQTCHREHRDDADAN